MLSCAAAESGWIFRAVVVVRAGLGQPALLLEGPAQREVHARPILLGEGQGLLEVRDGLARLLALHVHLGQDLPEGAVGRLELDGLLHPRQGLVGLALADHGQAEMGVGRGQVGLQPQGLQVRGSGLDVFLHRPQGIAQVVVQGRHVRLEPHRLLAMRQRLLGQAAVQQHLAQVGPRRAKFGSSSTARRKCRSASSIWPRSRSTIPRLLCAVANSGRNSSARWKWPTASDFFPSPCSASPRLHRASG